LRVRPGIPIAGSHMQSPAAALVRRTSLHDRTVLRGVDTSSSRVSIRRNADLRSKA
jgi:hypothetical protein